MLAVSASRVAKCGCCPNRFFYPCSIRAEHVRRSIRFFLPWLKPCGGPPPPPGPFAEAIVPVEAAKATDSATMAAIRGSDVRQFSLLLIRDQHFSFTEVPKSPIPKRSQHKHLLLAAHESKSFKFAQHKVSAVSALPLKADMGCVLSDVR